MPKWCICICNVSPPSVNNRIGLPQQKFKMWNSKHYSDKEQFLETNSKFQLVLLLLEYLFFVKIDLLFVMALWIVHNSWFIAISLSQIWIWVAAAIAGTIVVNTCGVLVVLVLYWHSIWLFLLMLCVVHTTIKIKLNLAMIYITGWRYAHKHLQYIIYI